MWTRADLKARGKAAFLKNYWAAVGVGAILLIATGGWGFGGSTRNNLHSNGSMSNFDGWSWGSMMFSMIALMAILIVAVIGLGISIFIAMPLMVGGNRFFMENREGQSGIATIFYAFKSGNYWNIVKTLFFQNLFIFLWSLLLIIPGIIKSYEYRMIPYILSENPGMDYKLAFRISKEMMDGQKMDTFLLDLSFILWGMLALITCGIVGIFFVSPYVYATDAELYAVLRAHAFHTGGLTTKELPGFGTYYN